MNLFTPQNPCTCGSEFYSRKENRCGTVIKTVIPRLGQLLVRACPLGHRKKLNARLLSLEKQPICLKVSGAVKMAEGKTSLNQITDRFHSFMPDFFFFVLFNFLFGECQCVFLNTHWNYFQCHHGSLEYTRMLKRKRW